MLKTWQKFLVVFLLVTIVVGPFTEKKDKNQSWSSRQELIQSKQEVIQSSMGTWIATMRIDQKKRLYWEYIYAQRKAEAETLELYPVKRQMENMKEYLRYGDQNREKHYREVAKKNNISYEDLILIVDEANAKMWQMPPR